MNAKTPYIIRIVLLCILLALLLVFAWQLVNGGLGSLGVFHFSFGSGFEGEVLSDEQRFSGIESLDIDTANYSVVVEPYQGVGVTAQFGSVNGGEAPEFLQDGSTLRIAQKSQGLAGSRGDGVIRIGVPVEGLASCTIDTASGSIRVDAVCDTLSLDSASGSILVTAGGGSADLSSVSGSVTAEAPFVRLEASTTSGSIRLSADADTREIDAETVSGSTRIRIADGVGYLLEYETLSGSVRDDYTGVGGSRDGRLSAGNGAVGISCESVSGSISLTDWAA